MRFPQEVLEHIGSYLTNGQQYECLFVCHSWYLVFQRTLYKRINIYHKHQFKLFIQTLSKQKGELVRELYLCRNRRVGITNEQVKKLTVYCPLLKIVDFEQNTWKYLNSHYFMNKLKYLEYLPPCISQPIANNAVELVCLSRLTFHGEWLSQVHQQQILIPILQKAPQLRDLTLNYYRVPGHQTVKFSLNEMEMINQKLRRLESLEITGSVQLIPSDITTYHKNGLRKLVLKANISPSWIQYLAHSYPYLKQLEVEMTSSYSKCVLPSNLFSLVLRNCLHLSLLQIDSYTCNHYLDQDFFDTLPASSLEEIKIIEQYQPVSRSSLFSPLVQHASHLVSSLCTEAIESDKDILCIIKPLSQFTQLTDLVIHCGHPLFECNLNWILNNCQALSALTIRSANITMHGDQKKSALQSLHLGSVIFAENTFKKLGYQCPLLCSLSLYDVEQDSGSYLSIDMPNNNFKSIVLSGVRLLQTQANAKIIKIHTDKTRWYHISNNRRKKLNAKRTSIAQAYHNTLKTHVGWQKDLESGMIFIRCLSLDIWQIAQETSFHEY